MVIYSLPNIPESNKRIQGYECYGRFKTNLIRHLKQKPQFPRVLKISICCYYSISSTRIGFEGGKKKNTWKSYNRGEK